MGWPGTGAPCGRRGTPGRGVGAPGTGGRGCPSLATRSGRGGTTGRTAGCPAKVGFAGAVRAGPGAMTDAGGADAEAGDRGAAGRCGTTAGLGRAGAGGCTPSVPPGKGCL